MKEEEEKREEKNINISVIGQSYLKRNVRYDYTNKASNLSVDRSFLVFGV